MKKEREVVMVATKGKITQDNYEQMLVVDGNYLCYSEHTMIGDTLSLWNLYILSDEDIKEGDWFVCKSKIYKLHERSPLKGLRAIFDGTEDWFNESDCLKIIATTNTSLNYIKHDDTVPYPKGKQIILPQIPQWYIEYYIEQYNKGNVITKVMVEYEEYHGINRSIAEVYALQESDAGNDWQDAFDERLNELGREYRLKLSNDNCIIIHNIEPIVYTDKDMNDFAGWYIKNTGQYSDDELALKEGFYLKLWENNKNSIKSIIYTEEEVWNILNSCLIATGKEIKATMNNIKTRAYIEFDGSDLKKWFETNKKK